MTWENPTAAHLKEREKKKSMFIKSMFSWLWEAENTKGSFEDG